MPRRHAFRLFHYFSMPRHTPLLSFLRHYAALLLAAYSQRYAALR